MMAMGRAGMTIGDWNDLAPPIPRSLLPPVVAEQGAYRLALVDAADGLAQEGGYGQHLDLVSAALRPKAGCP